MTSEAQKKAVARYDAKNTQRIYIKLNKNTDADILQHLRSQDNIQGYIKELIRNDMKRAD